MKLDFSFAPDPNASPAALSTTSGWIVVAPADGWLIQEYGTTITPTSRKFQDTTVGHVTYERGVDGRLRPVRVDSRSYNGHFESDPATASPPVEATTGEDFRFLDFRFGDRPERDFTLTAYGLPEFGQTVSQAVAARSFPWWTVGAAVGFGALALVLRRAARRGLVAPNPAQG